MHRVEDAARLAMANIADCEAPPARVASGHAFGLARWLPVAIVAALAVLWFAI